MSHLANNLKVLRDFENKTQTEFAMLFGVQRSNIGSWEQGRAEPKSEFVDKVCTYFNLTRVQLFKQRLNPQDLKPSGRIESVTEVKLDEARKRIELLERMIADKDEIISLLRRKI